MRLTCVRQFRVRRPTGRDTSVDVVSEVLARSLLYPVRQAGRSGKEPQQKFRPFKSIFTCSASRIETEDNLKEAIARLQAGEIGVNEFERYYGIPSRTLRRRKQSGNMVKLPLGPQGVFGTENEKLLVRHIQDLQKAGFAPTRENIRSLAYKFADTLGLHHRLNSETGMTGYDWLQSFLLQNPELCIRQSQGLSRARSDCLNREAAGKFFQLLSEFYEE
ncbi:hypothetical protein PR048_023886 [Dryococelus australis]|uniref:HTH psq-type domain-containing protein n=1 Tax=Dryococelus australis TaxID=614101 RepID=A0ABQ9GVE8_9NEOP|nr:hypothetical protein PR048_023886 [Dryococelus australis]